jgi:hypothetical protein
MAWRTWLAVAEPFIHNKSRTLCSSCPSDGIPDPAPRRSIPLQIVTDGRRHASSPAIGFRQ